MKTETYLLPEHWACALINDDVTGLTDQEHDELNEWLSDYKPGACLDCSGEPEFTEWHDAKGYVLPCNCMTFTFQKVTA